MNVWKNEVRRSSSSAWHASTNGRVPNLTLFPASQPHIMAYFNELEVSLRSLSVSTLSRSLPNSDCVLSSRPTVHPELTNPGAVSFLLS